MGSLKRSSDHLGRLSQDDRFQRANVIRFVPLLLLMPGVVFTGLAQAADDPASALTVGSYWEGSGVQTQIVGFGPRARNATRPYQYKLVVTSREGETFRGNVFVPPTNRFPAYKVVGTVEPSGTIGWQRDGNLMQAEFKGRIQGESIRVDFTNSSQTRMIAKGKLTLKLGDPNNPLEPLPGGRGLNPPRPPTGSGSLASRLRSNLPAVEEIPRGAHPVAPTGMRRGLPANATKVEYERFAAAFTMASNRYSEYLASADQRAQAIRPETLENPSLKQAAAKLPAIAVAYGVAQELKASGSSWSPEEIGSTLGDIFTGPDDLTKNSGFYKMLGKTGLKVGEIEAAKQVLFQASGRHGELWKSVIPVAKQQYGPDLGILPLRIGNFWALNTTGVPLTNLTVIVETDISKSLPSGMHTHVIYVERLEPDEMLNLPPWLVDAIPRPTPTEPATERSNCLRLTILSDQATCHDVEFDFRRTTKSKAWWGSDGLGFVPAASFRGPGRYEASTPIVNVAADQFQQGSHWSGTCHQQSPRGEIVQVDLTVTKRMGDAFEAEVQFRKDSNPSHVSGSIRNGVLQWNGLTRERHPRDGRGIPAQGEILGRAIDLQYSGPGYQGNPQQGQLRLVRTSR